MTGDELTRRQVLLAAAAGAVAAIAPLGRTHTARAAASGLAPARAATYRRLVGALQRGPGARRRPGGAARDFARWYADQAPTGRAHVDAVLDAMATGPRARSLARAAAPEDAALRAAAIGLVAIGCEAPPGEDERPVTSGLGAPA